MFLAPPRAERTNSDRPSGENFGSLEFFSWLVICRAAPEAVSRSHTWVRILLPSRSGVPTS